MSSSPATVLHSRSAAHQRARDRAATLLADSLSETGPEAGAIAELIAEGEANGWSDVVRFGLYVETVCARFVDHVAPSRCVAALLRRAEDDGDVAMMAAALAIRAQENLFGPEGAGTDTESDLARATVLLEDVRGPSTEAVIAHIECAYACERHDLWELQLAHYDLAAANVDPDEAPDRRRAALASYRVDVQLHWMIGLRELSAFAELADHADQARAACAHALAEPDMPDAWRAQIHISRELVDAISPPRSAAYEPWDGRGEAHGIPQLALALRESDPGLAFAAAQRAVEAIDPVLATRLHQFALAVAAELESAVAGTESAGLRWARELAAHRGERRTAMVRSVDSRIAVARLAAEHARLEQDAHRDELTGLANRRGLSRHVAQLIADGARTAVVAVVDLDRFKEVNDVYGHGAGDAVLGRVADLLRSGTRDGDAVARLGGDEFLIVMADADPEAARRRCEAIRGLIDAGSSDDLGRAAGVTASFGLAEGPLTDFAGLCAAADAALYRAKQGGRARVAC